MTLSKFEELDVPIIADTTISNIAHWLGYEVIPGECWGPDGNKIPGLGLTKDGKFVLNPVPESVLLRKLIRAARRKVDRGRARPRPRPGSYPLEG